MEAWDKDTLIGEHAAHARGEPRRFIRDRLGSIARPSDDGLDGYDGSVGRYIGNRSSGDSVVHHNTSHLRCTGLGNKIIEPGYDIDVPMVLRGQASQLQISIHVKVYKAIG